MNLIAITLNIASNNILGYTFYSPGMIYFFLSLINMFLSISSLQFNVPRDKSVVLPAIWKEFRGHSMIFAIRGILCSWVNYFEFNEVFKVIFVLLTILFADIITSKYKPSKNVSTTASMPYWTGIGINTQKWIKYFYTHSQFCATILCFRVNPFIQMYTLLPIQSAAFLLTLSKKNVISTYTYHLLYGLSLLSGYIILNKIRFVLLIPFISILMYLRITYRANKYALWAFIGGIFIKNYYIALISLPFLVKSLKRTKPRKDTNHVVISNDKVGEYRIIKIKTFEELKFKPGQHIHLYHERYSRPYTPIEINGKELTFLIKPCGFVSNNICKLYMKGSTVGISKPVGTKYFDGDDILKYKGKRVKLDKPLCISNGTGVTPFYSQKDKIPIVNSTRYNKFYGSGIKLWVTSEEGRLNEELIRELAIEYNQILTCGTPEFTKMVKDSLSQTESQVYTF